MRTCVKIGFATSFLVLVAISLASTSSVNAFVYEAYLEVVGGPVLNPNALEYSPPVHVTAEIVDCGLGYPADFPSDVVGKIALIQRSAGMYFWEKTQNAADAGALAAVIYNYNPGRFRGTLLFITDIAAVCISGDEGDLLLTLLASGPVDARARACRRRSRST